MDLAVIGAGRVGTALAVLLRRAGHRIVGVAGRASTGERVRRYLGDVPLLEPADAARGAEVVLIGTPDDAIAEACRSLASSGAVGGGRWVAHLSGATSLEVLAPAREAGAGVLSVHPLQTFPDVSAALDRIPGCTIAVTASDEAGMRLGERLAGDVGGRAIRLADEDKPLYHAAAVFASNYLVTSVAAAADVLGAAGVGEPLAALLPLSRATVENLERLGPETALTGPAVRGDAGTIERNLEALAAARPEAVAAYVAMAELALGLGERGGRLSAEARAAVEEVLDRWR